ncbi:hypothetical protein GCM10010269_15890 [Streptomyces humidus]|uniref:Uncharacterized protein n=1 Tax=Streptomyces humidus TaxID=52259 RepID=A0A918L258_9ACTN|nr:hypothetical protein [Streptomyces humidus]GGR77459.1 hypothetical protein GCM10010269_15890 [Streptomyces humidus]
MGPPWNADNYGLDRDHPGAQAYYDSQVAQFAEWGMDFVKADDMLFPYHEREIAAYARAIERSGRPIELSLSPGTDASPMTTVRFLGVSLDDPTDDRHRAPASRAVQTLG